MAGADVIEAAIGITLLLIVSYAVVGSIMTTAAVVSNAQMDMNRLQEERLDTNIKVTYSDYWWDGTYHEMEFRIKNTGNKKIDYTKLNIVIITKDDPPPTIFIKSVGDGEIGSSPVGTWYFEGIHQDESWTDESVNLNQWDPGEFLYGWMEMIPHPTEFHVFTPNGATGYLPVT
jgi:heme/copper-type cytochrome/quinol oxidase subunit 2